MIKSSIVRRLIELNLNPVPVKLGSKEPTRKNWTERMNIDEVEDFTFGEIGIATGYASLNLEALDFDLDKVEDPSVFMDAYNRMVPDKLLSKLVKQSTPKGGQHYIYRCAKIEGNQKLARNKKGEATIETRGVNGYIKCFPSDGYTMREGKTWADVMVITEAERDELFIVARQFDELIRRDVVKRQSTEERESFKKFKGYNEDPQVGIDLLEGAGWVFHSENGQWYNLTKPDSKSGDLHAGYKRDDLFFQCFSTAQDTFETGKGYNNHHLYAELKCNGNYKKAYAKLFEAGYGIEKDDSDKGYEQEQEDELDFVSTGMDEDDFLEQARKGEISLGVSTGFTTLDKNFRFKRNSFVFLLGLDNVGKSSFLSSLMVASNILHGFRWAISSPEAPVVVTRRNLIEAESGKPVKSFRNKPLEYQALLQRNRKNFFIIKNEKHSSIEEILEMGKKLYQRSGIDFLLIDPWSFYASSGDFSADTDMLSKIRVFAQKYCSVLTVDHPMSTFARTAKDSFGFLTMPTKYDVAGGTIKPNRCDDYICVHRVINHDDPTVRKTMQVSIQKVKDKSTGGEPHIDGEYTSLVWEERDGFTGYWDSDGNNPMYRAMKARKGVEGLISCI